MDNLSVNPAYWSRRRVLLTGHTGFKGAWLAFWLCEMGADVTGLALAPNSSPNLFELLGLQRRLRHIEGDINDLGKLTEAFAYQPQTVFHLAAQALVRPSYDDPVGTVAANVLGVASLMDQVRRSSDVKAVILVTSDKCYENRNWEWGYRETDALGGHDPYSASKGAAEIIASSMRRSFFTPHNPKGHPARIATVRAGNVIGGGDWSKDRLVPDLIRGCASPERRIVLRYPEAVRPWQHVLEPVAAYMGLAQQLDGGSPDADQAFNFAPDDSATQTVIEVAHALAEAMGGCHIVIESHAGQSHEAHLLRLDCSKVRSVFNWRPRFTFAETIDLTAKWYAEWRNDGDLSVETRRQIALHSAM